MFESLESWFADNPKRPQRGSYLHQRPFSGRRFDLRGERVNHWSLGRQQ